jgi:hypothetical protein
MTSSPPTDPDEQVPPFLSGDGVANRLAQSIDWSATPLGNVHGWPSSLKTIVGMLLHSRHPMFLWWGPELIQFYNDAYLPSFGKGKHPAAMGQRGADCWQEIWPIIGPQIDDVMSRGRPSWNEDQLVPIYRNGHLEEVYWTYGYSPIFDESGVVGGTLVVCTETTNRVLSERRLRTMRALTEKTAFAVDSKAMLHLAAQVFGAAPRDIPFALLFTVNARADQVQLVEAAGVTPEQGMQILDPALRRELGTTLAQTGSGNQGPFALASPLSVPLWVEPVSTVFVTPIARAPGQAVSGFVVFGLSPSLPFDDAYRAHLGELAEHLGLAQARIDAFRIRALAESRSGPRCSPVRSTSSSSPTGCTASWSAARSPSSSARPISRRSRSSSAPRCRESSMRSTRPACRLSPTSMRSRLTAAAMAPWRTASSSSASSRCATSAARSMG